jgi:hypothetical protein
MAKKHERDTEQLLNAVISILQDLIKAAEKGLAHPCTAPWQRK